MKDFQETVEEIAGLFAIEGRFVGAEEVETGLINSTWVASYESSSGERRRYILQRINESVFGDPLVVMGNVERVTRHINERVLRERKDAGGQTLSLFPGRDGRCFAEGPGGGFGGVITL